MPRIALKPVISALAAVLSTLLPAQTGRIEAWVTYPDRSALFSKQAETIAFSDRNSGRGGPAIVIDNDQQMQTIDGFGFALTGGSAELLMKMNPAERSKKSVKPLQLTATT
jgi:glucosylceramidase